MTTETPPVLAVDCEAPHRKALKVAASALCSETGFTHAEDAALETLAEMMQSYLSELGRSAQAYAELACRTQSMISDVAVALVDMGADIQSLQTYAKRPNKMVFMPPTLSQPSPIPRVLQVGSRHGHPSHIPDYLPAFPDPHTYIKTPTHKKPETDYKALREKAASQKRDVERALTRFIAKTGDTENLFPDDPYAFPLIASRAKPLPYLEALLPKEHEMEAQEEHEQEQMRQQKQQAQGQQEQPTVEEDESKLPSRTEIPVELGSVPTQDANQSNPAKQDNSDTTEIEGQIDNPYLRAIKMPKFKITKKSRY